MGDQGNRLPFGFEGLEQGEKPLGLCGGQHGGGFIKDQEAGVPGQEREDRGLLPLTDGQARGAGADVQAEAPAF